MYGPGDQLPDLPTNPPEAPDPDHECVGCGGAAYREELIDIEGELVHEDTWCMRKLLEQIIEKNSGLYLENLRLRRKAGEL